MGGGFLLLAGAAYGVDLGGWVLKARVRQADHLSTSLPGAHSSSVSELALNSVPTGAPFPCNTVYAMVSVEDSQLYQFQREIQYTNWGTLLLCVAPDFPLRPEIKKSEVKRGLRCSLRSGFPVVPLLVFRSPKRRQVGGRRAGVLGLLREEIF